MSFAMAHDGWAFSHWLWTRLKRHYGLFSVGDVYNDYLDNVDIPPEPDETIAKPRRDDRPTTVSRPEAEISIVNEDNPKDPGDWSTVPTRPIGRLRDQWDTLFKRALSQARVALIVLTKEYQNSGPCVSECQLINGEQESRLGAGRRLRIVVLCLVPLDTAAMRSWFPDAEFIVSSKFYNFSRERSDRFPDEFEPLLTDKEHWKITDTDFVRLLTAIGSTVR